MDHGIFWSNSLKLSVQFSANPFAMGCCAIKLQGCCIMELSDN